MSDSWVVLQNIIGICAANREVKMSHGELFLELYLTGIVFVLTYFCANFAMYILYINPQQTQVHCMLVPGQQCNCYKILFDMEITTSHQLVCFYKNPSILAKCIFILYLCCWANI